jgi:hypothetical protein
MLVEWLLRCEKECIQERCKKNGKKIEKAASNFFENQ